MPASQPVDRGTLYSLGMAARLTAIGSLVLVMVVWGSSFVVTGAALDVLPPFLLALLRFVLATALLLPLARGRGGLALLPRPLPLGTLTVMGLTGVTLFFVGTNLSLLYTTATDVAIVQ